MTFRRLALWFGLVAALAAYSRAEVGAQRKLRCSLDGNRIQSTYQVDLVSGGKVLESFCSIACAHQWPDIPPTAHWQVRDEVTGRVLDAARAHFIRSRVVTVPARRERTHVFAHWADAELHAQTHGGNQVPNPFAAQDGSATPAAGKTEMSR